MTDAVATIERLLGEAEALPDPQARALVKALAAALVDLVGDSLKRVSDIAGDDVMRKLADDELVGNLLVLSGMHPESPVVRAQRALEAATAELSSVGVVFEGIDTTLGGGVRVRVRAERGTPSDDSRVRTMVEAVVVSRAPDVESVQLELGGKSIAPAGFVSIERLRVHT